VLAATALPGNPYDGHTLAQWLTQAQRTSGCQATEVFVDKGTRSTAAPRRPARCFSRGQGEGWAQRSRNV
jgi:transposase, IS5 family